MLQLDTTSDVAEHYKVIAKNSEQFIGVLPLQVVDKQGAEVGNIAVFNTSINNPELGADDVIETVYVLVQDDDQVAITKDQLNCLIEAISQIP